MKSLRSTYTKQPDEKLTVAEAQALTQALVVASVQPVVVGTRWALIASVLATVLSISALAIALWR